MWILPLVGYVGLVFGFAFLTLAIASGLYYLSELVEEHTRLAKKLLQRLIYTVIALQILLVLVDGFPIGLSVLSVASHGIYSLNLRHFPVVKVTSPVFILSCFLVLLNHYLWFTHFSLPPPPPPQSSSRYDLYSSTDLPSFAEISSYFGLCVWLTPFALFVALSAGENVLPSMGSEYATGEGSSFVSPGKGPEGPGGVGGGKGGGGREGMAKAVVNGVRDWMGDTGELMGFWKGDKVRRF
ncbi:DUF396-domain-containing protein [Aulographum hederae CBS 113979]|uniref:DUF396-domain-containing protein n=1 Tax=Aulographum hederae CBS 113979 TaxID=1176131 RepID=A0A6G1GND9_9PEZI|nr:DUF396-domain-containing protein [Aulographum hederae CBS 113979]